MKQKLYSYFKSTHLRIDLKFSALSSRVVPAKAWCHTKFMAGVRRGPAFDSRPWLWSAQQLSVLAIIAAAALVFTKWAIGFTRRHPDILDPTVGQTACLLGYSVAILVRVVTAVIRFVDPPAGKVHVAHVCPHALQYRSSIVRALSTHLGFTIATGGDAGA